MDEDGRPVPPPPTWPPPPAAQGPLPPPLPPPTWTPPGSNRGAVAVVLGSLAVLALVVVGTATALAWLTAPQPGPGYPTLTEDEVRATARRAAEVGAALDGWWKEQLRQHGDVARYEPVGDRLTDGDDGVRCDGERVVPDDDLVDNAWFALCREGPTVAYDPAMFRRSDVSLQLTLAHEWGHVGQGLDPTLDEIVVDPDAPYAETELQADCYAGAWAADHFDADQVEEALRELRAIGDPIGTPQDDPDGHGTAAERTAAFLLGLDEGITACLPDRFDARP